MIIDKLQIIHERSIIELDDKSVDFDFSNIKEVYVDSGSYPVPIDISDEKWDELYDIYYDDIYNDDISEELGIKYDTGVHGDLVAMITNDGELIEMYDNPISAEVITPQELRTNIFVDSYEELSDRLNNELLSAAFDDLQTETRLER